MITLVSRLCALCAMSAVLQMMLHEQRGKKSIGLISGLLMLRLVLSRMQEIGAALRVQTELKGIFDCLMK